MLYRAMFFFFFFFYFFKLPYWRFSTRRFSHVWLYTVLALRSHVNKTWCNRDVIHRFCQILCYPPRTKSSQLCSTLAVEAIATPTASHPPTHTHTHTHRPPSPSFCGLPKFQSRSPWVYVLSNWAKWNLRKEARERASSAREKNGATRTGPHTLIPN